MQNLRAQVACWLIIRKYIHNEMNTNTIYETFCAYIYLINIFYQSYRCPTTVCVSIYWSRFPRCFTKHGSQAKKLGGSRGNVQELGQKYTSQANEVFQTEFPFWFCLFLIIALGLNFFLDFHMMPQCPIIWLGNSGTI